MNSRSWQMDDSQSADRIASHVAQDFSDNVGIAIWAPLRTNGSVSVDTATLSIQ